MAALSQQDVMAWAIARGFVQQDNGSLAFAYKQGRVVIEPLVRGIRISIEMGGDRVPLCAVNPARLKIDEYGMLAGAGLSTSFLSNLRSETDIPGWFTDEYHAEALQLLARRAEWDRGPLTPVEGETP